jgi:hypothetical protein
MPTEPPSHSPHPPKPKPPKRHKQMVSLLVPFREERHYPDRIHLWHWLRRYWKHELPHAEIVIGHNRSRPFSKTRAVNDAAQRAKGDIFVILDSDTYIPGKVITACVARIRQARRRDLPLWFIPYRHIYRLTRTTTKYILESTPRDPLRIPTPPPKSMVESTLGSMHGHWFGALIQIMPREAFDVANGMDERFVGWGGEDVAFLRAVDTLYGNHKTTANDVLHMWHHHIGKTHITRMWEGQHSPRSNEQLAQRYNLATGDRVRMNALVHEEGHGCGHSRWLSRWSRPLRSLGRWLSP